MKDATTAFQTIYLVLYTGMSNHSRYKPVFKVRSFQFYQFHQQAFENVAKLYFCVFSTYFHTYKHTRYTTIHVTTYYNTYYLHYYNYTIELRDQYILIILYLLLLSTKATLDVVKNMMQLYFSATQIVI